MSGFFRLFGGGAGDENSGASAKEWVAEGATLLDVRGPAEFAMGHPDEAINIPHMHVAARIGEIPQGKKVVVYCASGMRSAAAAKVLRKAGFEVLDIRTIRNYR